MIGRIVSHYELTEKIGQGGMGIVYRAEDLNLKRTVAIKFLRPDIAGNDQQRKRFKKEAQACASLNHPNIATIFNFVEIDDEVFFVMEYVEGRDLRDLLQHSQLLSIDHVIKYTGQIASGLKAAHDKDIIHRDIKPENIRITSEDQIKIMDFGIAKMPGQTQLTQDGSSLGTIAYMSPEQTRGHQVDKRTDIWSFGAMVYEMLTGEEPFKGHYNEAIVYSILNEPPESINSLRANVPEHIEQLVNTALQKNADDRFQSIDELIAALEPNAGASDQTDPEKGVKNRTALWGGLAILFIILISVFIFFQSDSPAEPENTLHNKSITANTHSQIMQELITISDTPTFMNRLNELRKSMRIAVGNQDDFTTHDGCYIFVLGINQVEAVFLFKNDRFYNISSNEFLKTLTVRYAGKTSVWVRDLSN